MKETRSLINGLLVCGVAFAMVSTLAAQTAKEEVAKVIHLRGPARCQAPGGAWQELRVGSDIKAGSVIQSGIESGSYVDVEVGTGAGPFPSVGAPDFKVASTARYAVKTRRTVLHLYSNTVLGVDKMMATETGAATVTDTELDLRKGHIVGNVKKLSAGSEFRVRYPKGVAAIRGSVFDMTVDYLKETNPSGNAAGEQVHCTFAMTSGTGAVSFTQPDGTTGTEVVQTMQAWDSSNPTVTTPISSSELAAVNSILPSLYPPPAGVVRVPDPGQIEIQYVSGTAGANR